MTPKAEKHTGRLFGVELDGAEYQDRVLAAIKAHHEGMRLGRLSRAESRRLLKATFVANPSELLGRAARFELEARVEAALAWAEDRYIPGRGRFLPFARLLRDRAVKGFYAAHTAEELRHEVEDERRRDAASRDDSALVDFLEYARKKIAWLQRFRPRTWHVAGLTEEEFRERAELELLALVRTRTFNRFERRAGVEATFLALRALRDRLRTRRQVYEVLPIAGLDTFAMPTTPENMLIGQQTEQLTSTRLARAEARLKTSRQRFWIRAFIHDIESDERGRLNAARVAGRLGKNRSSAIRALEAIRRVIRQVEREDLAID